MSSEKNRWESLSMLQDALKASLTSTKDSRQHVEVAKKAMVDLSSRELVEEEGDKITDKNADLFLRCIIEPYAVKTFKARRAICGPLADCLRWFLSRITEEKEVIAWNVLLENKQYKEGRSSVEEVLKNQYQTLELESESTETSIAILLELLTIEDLEMDHVVSIFRLLRLSIGHLRSLIPPEVYESDSGGPVDKLCTACRELMSSKSLLARFFALVENNDFDSVSDDCSIYSSPSDSDYQQDSDDGSVPDLDFLALQFISTIVAPCEQLDAFLENLRTVYQAREDSKHSEHQQSQLMKLWYELSLPKSAFMLDQCIDYFTSFPFPNSVLLLNLVEVIFTCHDNYNERIPLYKKIAALVSRLAMNISALNPNPQFFESCFSFVEKSYLPEVWRLERLWLFSLLCGESCSVIVSMEAERCDQLLRSLFVFCVSHKGTSAPTSLDQETVTVVSCVKNILNSFSASRPHSVFSSFLEVVIEKFKEHSFLLDLFLSEPLQEKYAERVTQRNLEVVSMLFHRHGQISDSALTRLLQIMLHSPQGRDKIQEVGVFGSVWVAVGKKCISSLKENSDLERNVIVCSVLAVCVVIGGYCFDVLVELLPSLYEHIIDADVPFPDFSSLIRLLLAHHDSSASSLSKFVESILQAVSESDELNRPLSVFDNFLRFLNKASTSDQQKLLSVFHAQMKHIIDLLVKDLHNDTKAALHKISRLALDAGVVASEGQDQVEESGLFKSNTSTSSVRIIEDLTAQKEGASDSDLHNIVELLERPDLVLRNGAIRRASLTQPVSRDDAPSAELEQSLIMTSTTRENIDRINKATVIDDGVPVFLQDYSGVGKTATVAAVAHQKGIKIVRISGGSYLSSWSYNTKMTTQSVDKRTEAFQENQLFAQAYENGQWVVFEELNQVPREVLKLFMDASESDEIILRNRNSALNPSRVIKRHPDFCLFAIDNRLNVAPFEVLELPSSIPCYEPRFEKLQFDELGEILKQSMKRRLNDPDETELAEQVSRMTVFHWVVTRAIDDHSKNKRYTTVSMRSLLAWGRLLTLNGVLTPLTDPSSKRCTWLIYGAQHEGFLRELTKEILKKRLKVPKALSFLKEVDSAGPKYYDLFKKFAEFGSKKSEPKQILVGYFWRRYFPSENTLRVEMATEFEICAQVHLNVKKTVTSAEFIIKYGMHTSFSEFWLVNWISEAKKLQLLSQEQNSNVGKLGASLYMSFFHNKGARSEILNIFAKSFKLRHSDIKLQSSLVPEMPIVLTKQLARVLTLILDGLRIEHPILLEGCAGVGKTSIGKAIAFLLGEGLHQTMLNSESEPSAMLGEQIPVNARNSESKVVWKDGPLTQAFKEGSVFLVDNIGQGDLMRLGRLNPILESPKYLCLTEKGEGQPLHCKLSPNGKKVVGPAQGFQFIATNTSKGPLTSGLDSQCRYLTAAFFDRFITVHVDNPSDLNLKDFQSVIEEIASRCLSKKASVKKVVDFCLKVKEGLSRHCHFVLFGSYISLIHITTLLCQRYPDQELLTLLSSALLASFGAQLDNPVTKTAIHDATNCIQNPLDALPLLEGVNLEGDFVLTESRRAHAQTMLLGVAVNKPVLLEGKSYVEKIGLIEALHGAVEGLRKLIVFSNSETTTPQNYFGTWMPHEGEFVFSKGMLVQAMEAGDWFVSDDFNLAPSVVISALMPFLEGDRVLEIPNADFKIHVHPRFRFFATQNSHENGKNGRNLLPVNVRNRFIAINTEDLSTA